MRALKLLAFSPYHPLDGCFGHTVGQRWRRATAQSAILSGARRNMTKVWMPREDSNLN
jgi:hypothetical protein